MLKVAIIGLGTIAPIHKNAIEMSDKAKLVAVCDINEKTFADYDGVNCYTDIDEMICKEELDCVHICLPHYLHVPVSIKCAQKGIHVFTEKPVSINYNQAIELFELEDKYSVKVGVCLQNRYNNTSIIAKNAVESGEYGKFLGSKAIVTWCRGMDYYNEAPWRGIKAQAGSGVMLNQSIHSLDLLYYIGGEVDSLKANVANFSLPETEIEDSVMANLEYKNSNARGMFFATIAFCQNSSVQFEIVFEEAVLKIDDGKIFRADVKTGDLVLLAEDKKLEGSKHYYGAAHFTAIDTFYSAIIDNTSNYISVQDAAYAINLVDKIFLSDEKNAKVEV